MNCIALMNVKLSQASLDAIKEIRSKTHLANILTKLLPTGSMANIFLGNGALKSSYNITQTDFEVLAKAVNSVPIIHRRVIYDIAARQAIRHPGKESQFWKGVADGCGIR